MSSSVRAQMSSSEYCSQTLDILCEPVSRGEEEEDPEEVVEGGRRARHVPLHALWPFFYGRGNLAELPAQDAHALDGIADVVGEGGGNLAPDNVGQLGPVAVCADHNLQRAVAVDAAKVKVALGGHVGDVCGDAALLAQLVDLRRGVRVVDGRQHHVDAVEVRGLELAVDMVDLALLDAVGDLFVEAVAGRHDGDVGVGIEDVDDASGRNLGFVVSRQYLGAVGGPTSPPPTTRTRLLRICHARIREPPPWISG